MCDELAPGEDYLIREDIAEDADWLSLPDTEFTRSYRHTWVLRRRKRPADPSFIHCPMPRRGNDQQERNAAIVMTYFHPFTLNPAFATEHVPFLGNLCTIQGSWHESMLHWFNGRILTEESKRYVNNYLAVTRARPDEAEDVDANSDDLISDEDYTVQAGDFENAIKTRIGSGRAQERDEEPEAGLSAKQEREAQQFLVAKGFFETAVI